MIFLPIRIIMTPLCNDCVHYLPQERQCKCIRILNLSTGELSYYTSSQARADKLLCGPYGKYYQSIDETNTKEERGFKYLPILQRNGSASYYC